jgi:hypothetical protein
LRGRAGPALAGGFERRWAGSTYIFKVLSNLIHCTVYLIDLTFYCVLAPTPCAFLHAHAALRAPYQAFTQHTLG